MPLRIVLSAALALLAAGAPAGAAIPSGNLIVNGGGETGPASSYGGLRVPVPGWATPDNTQFRAADVLPEGSPQQFVHASTPGVAGCRVFYGGDLNSDTRAQQVLDVSGAAAEIDAGLVTTRFSARLGSFDESDDYAQAYYTPLAANGSDIGGSFFLDGQSGVTLGETRLNPFSSQAPLPVGTRAIRVTLHASGGPAEASEGYIDNVALTLDGTDPATFVPPAGCNPPTGATGAATEVGAGAATLAGSFDPRGEQTHAQIEYGATPNLGQMAGGTDAAGGVGSRGFSARVTGLQPGTIYYFRAVAQNAYGRAEGTIETFTTPSGGAAISDLGVKPRAFKRSTTISYTLSADATVTFTVERRKAGRRVKGKCRKRTRRNARKKKCDLRLKGSFRHAGKAGSNSLTFNGKLRGRKLKPGRYNLVATPQGGTPTRTGFRIKR